jgi:hypothetical protein
VLRREESRHQRGAGGRAHARVRERVVKRDTILLERREARQVLLGPADREVLHRALLVGDEHDDVHAVQVSLRRLCLRAGDTGETNEATEAKGASGCCGAGEETLSVDAGSFVEISMFGHAAHHTAGDRRQQPLRTSV